jgi:hypothetical protein
LNNYIGFLPFGKRRNVFRYRFLVNAVRTDDYGLMTPLIELVRAVADSTQRVANSTQKDVRRAPHGLLSVPEQAGLDSHTVVGFPFLNRISLTPLRGCMI